MSFYLFRFLIPHNLAIDYPHPDLSPAIFIALWAVMISLFIGIWLRRGKNPLLFFATSWWLICLLPVSGLIYVGPSFTSDRYLYLAIAGPLIAAGLFCHHRFGKSLSYGISTVVAITWAALSYSQTKTWKGSLPLFLHTTEAQPLSSLGWSNLGTLYQKKNENELAKNCFERATKIHPQSYISWHNIGVLERKAGRDEEAQEAYRRAIESYPNYAPSLLNLGIILRDKNQLAEAEKLLQRACEGNRFQNLNSLWVLVETQILLGRSEAATTNFRKLESFPEARRQHLVERMNKARSFLGGNLSR